MNDLLRRGAAAALSLAAVGLLVTGCAGRADIASSTSPLPRPSATATASATPPVTPSATATAPASTAPTAEPTVAPTAAPVPETPAPVPATEQPPAPEPATARCVGSDLSLEYRADPEASGAGSSAFDLIFTNTTDRTCTLAGIPGVYAAGADGSRLGAVASADGPNPSGLLPLAPAAQADVRVAWHAPGAFGCPTATSAFLVAEVIDAADAAVRAPAAIEVCTDSTVYLDASTYTLLG
ncbi:DUF4232 domain-containing protein [Rathayibacter sp. VKM Ac-2804]|uniref:DUF4232 domain-containing protein n=1 Tax=unclassified Rathayibacter TaxID=2609250 RepID=UPI00132EAF99|nr:MULTISPECIES: DUF4232 domain-containing protein [unclassified Rathayibacter]NRG42966.1 DUF4232 domain-containing protein [Rathayibacter sp. VKM Ac-2835]QHF24859.1 DUF4232 domain-containing protein [Rathayibacter sp. VKM Ac-2804]